jgi:xanthine dehydrogenase YagR molybdenum-binding subunit
MRTFGAIFVEVGVDPALGLLRLRRAVGSYSVGRIINPRTARAQMTGAIIWGWGMAAMEASHHEPTLGRWLSKNLAGVAIPVNADIPGDLQIHFVDEFDAHASPLGAKGIGELGATGVAAAVANAVFHATGKRVRELPITPDKLVNVAGRAPVQRADSTNIGVMSADERGPDRSARSTRRRWHAAAAFAAAAFA